MPHVIFSRSRGRRPGVVLAVVGVSCASLLVSCAGVDSAPARLSIHDPAAVLAYEARDGRLLHDSTPGATRVACLFGTHRVCAKSSDLIHWVPFETNLTRHAADVFAPDTVWSATQARSDGRQYHVEGNTWAPHVLWNDRMGCWCQYMSVNGDGWRSSIVLLTAADLRGPWRRRGVVVQSGFRNTLEARRTDFFSVCPDLGELPARYAAQRDGFLTYGLNAIDPFVAFDHSGRLFMTYGSWFGGIYALQLDPATGLRTGHYELTDISDPYFGLRLAGGNHASGEGSWLLPWRGRRYLLLTLGELWARGGYNMRLFRCDEGGEVPAGPWHDAAGHNALWAPDNDQAGERNGNVGNRLMSYYRWSHQADGQVAQGHCSTIEWGGRLFLLYHTRFTDERRPYELRVHELYLAPNGWLAAAPFEWRGETGAEGVAQTPVPGQWHGIEHGWGTDNQSLECRTERAFTVHADGSVEGAATGACHGPDWTLGGTTYHGVYARQVVEETDRPALVFSGVSDDGRSLWAYHDLEQ